MPEPDPYSWARWQGGVDRDLAELKRRMDGLNGSVSSIERDITNIKMGIDKGVVAQEAVATALGVSHTRRARMWSLVFQASTVLVAVASIIVALAVTR